MNILRTWRKPVASAMIVAITALSTPIGPASAAIVGTDSVLKQTQGSDRDRVRDFLNRDDVQSQLESLGVSPDEAKARVSALSDAEISKIAGRLDTLPAGEGLGAIVGAAVLIFLVLLITDLVGLTQVFGFTNKGSLNPN